MLPHCVLSGVSRLRRGSLYSGGKDSLVLHFCTTGALWETQTLIPVSIVNGLLVLKCMKYVKNSKGTVQP